MAQYPHRNFSIRYYDCLRSLTQLPYLLLTTMNMSFHHSCSTKSRLRLAVDKDLPYQIVRNVPLIAISIASSSSSETESFLTSKQPRPRPRIVPNLFCDPLKASVSVKSTLLPRSNLSQTSTLTSSPSMASASSRQTHGRGNPEIPQRNEKLWDKLSKDEKACIERLKEENPVSIG